MLVLGLVTTHSSAALNLVLIDFKGGATFRRLLDRAAPAEEPVRAPHS